MGKKELSKTYLKELYRFPENRVGCLTEYADTIVSGIDIEDAREYFEADKNLRVIPVEVEGGVAGLLSRDTCMAENGKGWFGLGQKTVGEVYNAKCPIYDAMQSVNDAVKRVLDEGYQGDFMIYHAGRFLGTSSVRALLVHSARLRAMDLNLAGRVQKNFMFVASDKAEPLALEWHNQMANEVGGDFIQYRRLGPASWMLGIFDIAGKGISAALSTSLIAAYFATLDLAGSFERERPTSIVRMLHQLMGQYLIEGGFLACAFVFFDSQDGYARIFNCGLGPIYVYTWSEKSGTKHVKVDARFPPLGMPGVAEDYVPARLKLSAGIRFFISTDGLADMRNPEGRAFGSDALETFLLSHGGQSPAELKEEWVKFIRDYIGTAPQTDDITFAVAEWKG